MKKLITFNTLRSKLLVAFSFILIGLLFLGGYTIYVLNNVNKTTESILNEELPILIYDERLAYTMANRLSAARAYLLTGDNSFVEQFNEFTKRGIEYESIIRETGGDTDRFNQIINKTVEWREDITSNVFDVYQNGNEELARKNLNESYLIARELMIEYEDLANTRGDTIIELEQNILDGGKRTLIIVGIIILLVIILTITIALTTSNVISKQIGRIKGQMEHIASGDLANEPLKIRTNDELGRLTSATNEMSNNMRTIINKIQTVSETVSSQSEELTNSANEVMNATEQVAATLEEIAAGTESQANNATELSNNMGVFTSKIQEATQYGEHVQQSSNDVYEMTNAGAELMQSSMAQMTKINETVHNAVERVEGLDKHTQEITELVSVIKDIAEQTNLLALNAAIEAARAGEHGKGFAVVAEEVKKLAEQSSHSVANITEIVSRIQNESSVVVQSLKNGYKDVIDGTEQVTTTGETFARIRKAVTETVSQINQISSILNEVSENNVIMSGAVQDIAAISEQSAAGVQEVSASTEQTSSSMQQVATSSEDLAKLAEELHSLITHFKL